MRLGWAARQPPASPTLAFAAIGVGALLVARYVPLEKLPLPACVMRSATGWPCPTCGMTRAFVRFAHGDPTGALAFSPLGTLLAAAAVALGAWALLRLVGVLPRSPQLELRPAEQRVLRVGAVLVLAANWSYLVLSGAAN